MQILNGYAIIKAAEWLWEVSGSPGAERENGTGEEYGTETDGKKYESGGGVPGGVRKQTSSAFLRTV